MSEEEEGGAAAAAPGSSGEEQEEEAGSGGSSDEEEGSDEEDGAMFRPQQRPRIVLGRGAPAEGEEPLNEEDLQEWGVGAMAANPEEPVGFEGVDEA